MNVLNEQQLFGPTLRLQQLREKREGLEEQLRQRESEADELEDRYEQARSQAIRSHNFAKNARYFGIGGLALGAGGLFTGLKMIGSNRPAALVALGVGLVGLAGVAVSLNSDGAKEKAQHQWALSQMYAQTSQNRAQEIRGQLNGLRGELQELEGLEAERKAEEAKLRALEVEFVEDAIQVGDFSLSFS